MSISYERAYILLEVTEKCAQHSGKLNSLGGAALSELLAMNEEVRAEAAAKAKAQAEKDAAVAQAAAQAQAADIEAKNGETPKAIPSSSSPTLAERRL